MLVLKFYIYFVSKLKKIHKRWPIGTKIILKFGKLLITFTKMKFNYYKNLNQKKFRIAIFTLFWLILLYSN